MDTPDAEFVPSTPGEIGLLLSLLVSSVSSHGADNGVISTVL